MNRRFAGSTKHAELIKRHRAQRGLTLLETLIAMALGLMVLAGVLQFVSRLVEGNTSTLKVTRLEQDVRTLMDMMIQDVRGQGSFPKRHRIWGRPPSL